VIGLASVSPTNYNESIEREDIMTIKGSDITAGTVLQWVVPIGKHYPATVETTYTVDKTYTHPANGKPVMTFVEEYPQNVWYVDLDKDYETESHGMIWLEGDPNNPL
jgi:hypothetical protein